MEGIFMSRIDQITYQLCQDCLCRRLTIQELSILLPKSYRQTQRILKKVANMGMAGVKHGNSGKIPHKKQLL